MQRQFHRSYFYCAVRTILPTLVLFASNPLPAAAPAAKGTLSGTVVNPEGKPVAGARVSMLTYEYGGWPRKPGTKPLAEATTDSSGRFRLGPIEPAYRMLFDMQIEAEGFAPQYVPSGTYSIFPDHDSDLGEICVFRGRVVAGQVLDADGKPRAGASVRCEVGRLNMGYVVNRIGPARTVITDADGRFRSPLLAVGDAGLTVQEPERRVIYRAVPMKRPDGEEVLNEPIRLEYDAPIEGAVKDENGQPIEGAVVDACTDHSATSDAKGHFVLRGFEPNPYLNVRITKDAYVTVDRTVQVSDKGFTSRDVYPVDSKPVGLVKDFTVEMKALAWIEGRAVDAETGEPVRLDRVVLCTFERKPNGEIVRAGCKASDFKQPDTGRFRVPYSFPYEYTLTFSAAGYHDAETFTPLVKRLQPIDGIVVKLKKDKAGTKPEMQKQRFFGAVTRDGMPVKNGWVGLWALRRAPNAVNAWILRGRTVTPVPAVYSSVPIQDGTYSIETPYQSEGWYVVVEEPDQAPTQVGPLSIGANEEKKLDIACVAGGGINGRVEKVPDAWKGQLWVVAFNATAVRAETRVDSDGRFSFKQLSPGKYGLKIGHDGCEFSEHPEVSRANGPDDVPKEAWTRIDDPWQTATVVNVESGHETEGVRLQLPR
jgi:protocatechuate 3,4-dioxygenase beta subunit